MRNKEFNYSEAGHLAKCSCGWCGERQTNKRHPLVGTHSNTISPTESSAVSNFFDHIRSVKAKMENSSLGKSIKDAEFIDPDGKKHSLTIEKI